MQAVGGGGMEKQEQFLFNGLAGDAPPPISRVVNGSKYLFLKDQVKRRKEVNCRSHLVGSFSPQGQRRCLLAVPRLISRLDDSSKVCCSCDTFYAFRVAHISWRSSSSRAGAPSLIC